MFTEALFLIGRKWEQIKCLPLHKWINKMWFKKKDWQFFLEGNTYLMICQFLSCPSKENGYVDRYPPWIYWHYKNMSC